VPDHIQSARIKNRSPEARKLTVRNSAHTGDPPPSRIAPCDHAIARNGGQQLSGPPGGAGQSNKEEEDLKFNVDLPKWMDECGRSQTVQPTTRRRRAEPFKKYAMTLREIRPIRKFAGRESAADAPHRRISNGDKSYADWDVTERTAMRFQWPRALIARNPILAAGFNGK